LVPRRLSRVQEREDVFLISLRGGEVTYGKVFGKRGDWRLSQVVAGKRRKNVSYLSELGKMGAPEGGSTQEFLFSGKKGVTAVSSLWRRKKKKSRIFDGDKKSF